MALIIRIDVDRPYGRRPLGRHLLSRLSSDLYFPRIAGLGYLAELETMLGWLNEAEASSYVFFRRCTLPSAKVMDLMISGRHEVGVHLENSRSFDTFAEERQRVESHVGQAVQSVSKHGSGGMKYGWHHYAPYEPEKYVDWAEKASMRVLLGNLEDPTLAPTRTSKALWFFPSAFWLEPAWRDTGKFPVAWLLTEAQKRDIVLLVHPENVLADRQLSADFKKIISSLESRMLQ
jgi:hypothetical protein